MSQKVKPARPSDLVHWEANPNYTRLQVTLEGLDATEFTVGTPLEEGAGGAGTGAIVGLTATDVKYLLMEHVGTLATSATKEVTVLAQGPAIVIEQLIKAGTTATAADIVTAIKAGTAAGLDRVEVQQHPTYATAPEA